MSSYAEDVDAIAQINAGVPGITVAYGSTNLPVSLTAYPAAMVIVAPGDWSRFGSDEYVIRVYVAPVVNGNPAVAYQKCLALIEGFLQTYSVIPTINDRPLMHYPHGHAKSPRGFGTSGFYYTVRWGVQESYGFEVYLPLGPRPVTV